MAWVDQSIVSENNLSDDELIAGLMAGDNRIYQLAMSRFGGAMLASARTICPLHAEDAVQEAWVACIRGIAGFQRRSALKTWLIGITINQALNYLRKNHRNVSLDGMASSHDPYDLLFDGTGAWHSPVVSWTDDSPDKLLEAHAMRKCIDHHLDNLPSGQRMALVLTDFQSISVDEVCTRLVITQNHYRVLLHRARISLFHMLNHFEATGEC